MILILLQRTSTPHPTLSIRSREANTACLAHYRGANVTIKGAGTTSQDIEEGAYVKVQVKFGLVTILKTTADFCEQVKNADLECPIEKGKLIVQKDFTMPEEIPNVSYSTLDLNIELVNGIVGEMDRDCGCVYEG